MNKIIFLLLGSFVFSGCAGVGHKSNEKAVSPVYYAVAVIQPTKGSKTSGQVNFAEAFGKVKVIIELSGLDKNSKHGFHIHEFGDCTAADASSAGGHYNPEGVAHGSRESEEHHVGDLGNVVTDSKGRARLTLEVPNMSINGHIHPILGRGVIVHKDVDDFISQPTGGAGARIGCGVIGASAK
ncbi:MAG: superoxide dismutase family protein [Bdellovibrionales bacterium]|nr:superoxide dismutase family protein [Bdellovibrionales bacterium]